MSAVLLLLTGCGPSGPKYAPVSGAVTLDGKPVAGAAVAFFPLGPGGVAAGNTDATGRFVLSSHKKGDGIPPGSYSVAVTLFKAPASSKPRPKVSSDGMDLGSAYITDPGPQKKPVWIVPEKYSSVLTSGLTAEVKDGDNEFKFELKSK